MQERSVSQVIRATPQLEGEGMIVTRPFPTARLDHLDPFLLLDRMGPATHGPGEAKDADVGIAGGVGKGAIFRKGKIVGTYPEDKLMDALLAEIDKILIENGKEPYSQKAPKLSHAGQLTPGRSVPAGQRT